jgi:hypothetical protein
MITLVVEDYCQNCPEFKPSCRKFVSKAIHNNRLVDIVDISVQCKKKDICARIKKYIEAEMSKGGK